MRPKHGEPGLVILFSHPTGNANVRHAALGLQKAGLLDAFWTTVTEQTGSPWTKALPASLRAQLTRRSYAPALTPYLHTQPARELLRMTASRLGLQALTRHETGPFCVDAVYRALDHKVASQLDTSRHKAVYAYEDGAADSFARAQSLGLPRLYDLPIGYWRAARRIMTDEAQRNPAWAMTIPGNLDSETKTARKDSELHAATHVFVASTFTKTTLQEAPGFKAPVTVIPYGAPSVASTQRKERELRPSGPLRVLYVGSLGQRKGLSYLFASCAALGKHVSVTVIGRKPAAHCAALDQCLASVTWIPSCSHAEVLRHMAEHDVFVFPSLFEGFGLVLLEAMALGMPIIATAHTAAPDLLSADGHEGFIVPVQDSTAITEKLSLLCENRGLLRDQANAAARRARTFTWESYERALAEAVRGCLPSTSAAGKSTP